MPWIFDRLREANVTDDEMNVPEPEFRALLKRKGLSGDEIDDAVYYVYGYYKDVFRSDEDEDQTADAEE